MNIDGSQGRMAAFLGDNADKVVARWSELVAAGTVAGSPDAVRAELADLLTLIIRSMSGADESAAGELKAALAELSRSRARTGASPSETALSVFALKDAVYELI